MALSLMLPGTENYEIIHERKFWTHEISTRKTVALMKYSREKILDPQNTHKKKLWTHKIPTRKKLRPTKYLRGKTLDP